MRGRYSDGFDSRGGRTPGSLSAERGAARDADEALVERFKRILLDEVDLHELGRLDDGQRRVRLERVMAHLVSREGVILSSRERNGLIRRVVDESVGLGVLEPLLADIYDRLSGVTIECLDWTAFVDRYDRPETLFYLDPPYYGSEDYYGRELFDRGQFALMAERLHCLKGRFILSINDVPAIREIFAGFAMEPVELFYGAGGGARPAEELIISGR